MNVVERIIKRKTEMLKKGLFPPSPPSNLPKNPGAFSRALEAEGLSVIAEIKKSSPSSGPITSASVEELAGIYHRSPVRCISVLTEDKYFGGSASDISKVRKITSKPLLMKDFIIFAEQIYLAARCGADAVLLISSILSGEKLRQLNHAADRCSLDALNEVHSREDLNKLRRCGADIKITGVNSRNLRSLEVDPALHGELLPEVGNQTLKVAESGIKDARRLGELEEMGYDGVLIGQSVLGAGDPAEKLKELSGE